MIALVPEHGDHGRRAPQPNGQHERGDGRERSDGAEHTTARLNGAEPGFGRVGKNRLPHCYLGRPLKRRKPRNGEASGRWAILGSNQ
jgi:hypothetical protein